MKKSLRTIVLMALSMVMLISCIIPAAATPETNSIIYLEDGSYITVELEVIENRAAGTKTGSKTYRYKGSDGVEEWSAVLTGIFTYTGTSASCTSAGCSVTISDTAWYLISKTSNRSGNSAVGEVTMGRKFLGITIDEETLEMRITCDGNGNLS